MLIKSKGNDRFHSRPVFTACLSCLAARRIGGCELLLMDQQLSCGFWKAFGSLLSTLFCGVSPLLMFLSLFSPTAPCQEFMCTHTLDTLKDGQTCVSVNRLTGGIDASDASKTQTYTVERGGQITSFNTCKANKSLAYRKFFISCMQGKKEKRAFFLESDHSLPLQPRKENIDMASHL